MKTCRSLSKAPSAVVTASLEDGLAVETRPNMPGTIGEWPNWSIPLPEPLEEIEQNPLIAEIARALSRSRKRKSSAAGAPRKRRKARST